MGIINIDYDFIPVHSVHCTANVHYTVSYKIYKKLFGPIMRILWIYDNVRSFEPSHFLYELSHLKFKIFVAETSLTVILKANEFRCNRRLSNGLLIRSMFAFGRFVRDERDKHSVHRPTFWNNSTCSTCMLICVSILKIYYGSELFSFYELNVTAMKATTTLNSWLQWRILSSEMHIFLSKKFRLHCSDTKMMKKKKQMNVQNSKRNNNTHVIQSVQWKINFQMGNHRKY